MVITTDELLKNIQIAIDMDEFTRANQDEFLSEPPHDYLNSRMQESGLELSRVCALSGLDMSYCYRIFSGVRAPGRNALLHITLAMGLSIDETQHALRLYQLARLDPRNYRDAAILFAISRGYTLNQTTELLFELGETEL